MKRSQAISSAIFVGNLTETNLFASAEECTDFCPPKNKNVPLNFSQGDKLSPSDQILAQTAAWLAQLGERRSTEREVTGSDPGRTNTQGL